MNRLLRLLYPSCCKMCGANLPAGTYILCRDCLEKGGYWMTERFSIPDTDGADAPLVYQDFVRLAMHAYKFHYRRAYADWFAQLSGDCLSAYLDSWKPDLITFVPLSFGRWMKRGYNQSALAARLIAKRFDLPCESTLRKHAFIRTQSGMTHEQRAANIAGAFRLRPHAAIPGRRIVLVDDVITTGSTMSECARILRGAGASAVFALGMTKTPLLRRE